LFNNTNGTYSHANNSIAINNDRSNSIVQTPTNSSRPSSNNSISSRPSSTNTDSRPNTNNRRRRGARTVNTMDIETPSVTIDPFEVRTFRTYISCSLLLTFS
jgi:hypothetical protein